jgi:hypothetical protein
MEVVSDSFQCSRRAAVKALLLLPALRALASAQAHALVFSSSGSNDLYGALADGGAVLPRYDTPAEAVARAPRGGSVLLLADDYPDKTTRLDPGLWEQVFDKSLRLYVEYPSWLPGLDVGPPRSAQWQRIVVASDAFLPELPPLRILQVHDCRFVPVRAANADLVLARVAGFDSAIYGLPENDVSPILFRHGRGNVLIATTKLSHFLTARYAPAEDWPKIWKSVLGWLSAAPETSARRWTPRVRPSFARSEALPINVELEAFRRGVSWFGGARMLVDASWKHKIDEAERYPDRVGPGPGRTWPLGNGTEGLLEGFSSNIRHDGSQWVRWYLRSDCMGEGAMATAFSAAIDASARARHVAANLNDFVYFRSPLAGGPRSNPQSASFGLLGWSLPNAPGVYYGDDNARCMLGTMATAALLKSDHWERPLLRCLLANLRTTGRLGFRGNRLEEGPLQKDGWRHYFESERINYAPHYEAYLWACFLWAFHKTGLSLFLDRARNAIRMTVAAYPEGWRWTNGLQQERARILLPLAWLVRVDDRAEYREWLRRIATDLLALQHESGALREEIGPAESGRYGPPKSNEEYGTKEAPLIQQNGDPLCDLLYTTNFAFLGLQEAASATGERLYLEATEKLAKFLCRVQVRSGSRPELDGAWFRGFDYRRWDYWASNADAGWGAWSVETGWTQAWIASLLAMRHMKTSLWQLTASSRIARHFRELLPIMVPGGV